MKRYKYSTLELEVAIARQYNPRRHIIVPNVSWGANIHECDLLILSKSGYATEVEIKVSLSDLKKDFTKKHKHDSDKIKYLWYCVPDYHKDIALELIPEKAGLLIAQRYQNKTLITHVRESTARVNCKKWSDEEMMNVMRLGCMRIWNLKSTIISNMGTIKYLREKENEQGYYERTMP
jgi:hypothetical protein